MNLNELDCFYPYYVWDNFEKCKEGWSTKDSIYNSLTNRAIGDKNYEYVLNVCKEFRMKIMNYHKYGYHDLWWQVDVFLLVCVCVFETFRRASINYFELDPAHYLSTTDYALCAMKFYLC